MKNKIAFIICTNNETELSECFYYLEKLNIPSGYEVEIISVKDATSMTRGYNEGMNSSNAKYKIYIHQDLFILNRNFLYDILSLFQKDKLIGIIGCIGCRKMPSNAYAITAWDTGKIFHNSFPHEKTEYQDEFGQPTEVAAVDGCFIATQYDIPWREDLFDGWDFYDISLCYEFHKIGKKIIVPYQEVPWCYHDNSYSKMNAYHKYRNIFCREYQNIFPFTMETERESISIQYSILIEKTRHEIEKLIDSGNMLQVCTLFDCPENKGYLALREYELLADIYRSELNLSENKFYNSEMGVKELQRKLQHMKFLVKRLEFNIGSSEECIQLLANNFSLVAIHKTILSYCIHKEEIWENILSAWPHSQSPL